MALSELLLAAQFASGTAEAADYKPAHLSDMAAECVPTPKPTTETVGFPVLRDNEEAFNKAVAEIMAKKLSKAEAASLLADALLAKVDGQVQATDLITEATTLDGAFNNTAANSPSGVESARAAIETARISAARQGTYLSLLVDPKNRALKPDALFTETGISPQAIDTVARLAALRTFGEGFKEKTSWDCGEALAYVGKNGQFPSAGTDLKPEQPTVFNVAVTLPDAAQFAKAETSTIDLARGALITEWALAEDELKRVTAALDATAGFERRYKVDGQNPVISIELDPKQATPATEADKK